jgi:hypothetical protein
MQEKKGCPQERNLREIYTENTMFCLLSFFWCCFCLHITEYEQIRGVGEAQNVLGPRGVKHPNMGLCTGNIKHSLFQLSICQAFNLRTSECSGMKQNINIICHHRPPIILNFPIADKSNKWTHKLITWK